MLYIAMTTLEKLQMVPTRFWVNAVILIAGGVLALLLVRHAAEMHRGLLSFIISLFVVILGFQWIYERNEPDMLTPLINEIAPFFPSKINYRN
jgi:hypothetical protein